MVHIDILNIKIGGVALVIGVILLISFGLGAIFDSAGELIPNKYITIKEKLLSLGHFLIGFGKLFLIIIAVIVVAYFFIKNA